MIGATIVRGNNQGSLELGTNFQEPREKSMVT